jgi:uncharacterized protein YecE (DUF72 family)
MLARGLAIVYNLETDHVLHVLAVLISSSDSLPMNPSQGPIPKQPPYYLGCPIWACPRWTGSLFSRHAQRGEWLSQYSQVFHTVEGNSTFYGMPKLETVQRWAETTAAPFRFVLKFHRSITHERRLLGAEQETDQMLDILDVLRRADRLGPSFLQLPPGFSPHHLEDLAKYLRRLPREYPYAVEVRHHGFFDSGPDAAALNQLLAELGVDRVIFDSRCLFSGAPEDEYETSSQNRKPQLPVHPTVTGRRPIIRLIGRDDPDRVLPWIREWVPVVAGWIEAGLRPYVFAHAPDDLFAPQIARRFHEELRIHADGIAEMPPWPGEQDAQPRQLALF